MCPAVQSHVVGVYALHASLGSSGALHLLAQLDDAISDTMREWGAGCAGLLLASLAVLALAGTAQLHTCAHRTGLAAACSEAALAWLLLV